MPRTRVNVWLALAAVGGMAYPVLVYVGLTYLSPAWLAGLALGLIVVRLWGIRGSPAFRIWSPAFAAIAAVIAVLSLLAPIIAVKAYPALVSLAVGSVFAMSLIWPPTAVERLARLTEPGLSTAGQVYTRRVTQIWVIFLFANVAISTASGVWGSTEQWTLWNGLISYLLMGALFGGEMIVRRYLWARA